MPTEGDRIDAAINTRSRFRRGMLKDRSVGERFADFARLQQASFLVLCASPKGYQHFLRRNMQSRRAEVIDGVWRPVSTARCAQQP
jgi:hypothetical protein